MLSPSLVSAISSTLVVPPVLSWANLAADKKAPGIVAGVSIVNTLAMLLAIYAAVEGFGPFVANSPEENAHAVQLFVIRDGNVVDRRELFWEKVDDYKPTYFLGEVLQRYYQDNLFIPPEVLIPFEVEECDLLTAWLTEQAGRKVGLRVPQRGKSVDRIELANRNARLSHESRFRKSTQDRFVSSAADDGKVRAPAKSTKTAEALVPTGGAAVAGPGQHQ